MVIRLERGEWHPCMPERLDQEELADWRAGRDAIYQLAAPTVGCRRRIIGPFKEKTPAGEPGFWGNDRHLRRSRQRHSSWAEN
jgi:hypothetical protein